MILVTGASGHVGGELVRRLAAEQRPVRALLRSASDASSLPDGVEPAEGDLNRPESLGKALTRVDGVFLLGGFADMPGVLAAARKAEVGHVVALSSRSVIGGRPDNAVAAMHLDTEAAVRASEVPWTILRPSGFMSNTFEWLPQLRAGDVVRAPFANVPIAAIDPHDIAAVAATVLNRPEHFGLSHELSGPAALRPADRLAALADALHRPLRFQAQPDDEARGEMLSTIPARYVEAFFRFFADGEFDDTPVRTTVTEITGRPARTFRDWVEAHIDVFRCG
ncbi:uncharacterized protein YbjT (DUF2867 family) [Catenulispora sp. MAP12-49]|uniref:SDR family oxidoreductase n=1 Tax=Catenulispora sp. MAP12-49 TaxID=3156302 RepID=UPI003517C3D3